ncbi:MAG: VOC family protein [Thermomicrobiales bacterium]|nr:VOC family protein [Thermomicrobiales bacterium]
MIEKGDLDFEHTRIDIADMTGVSRKDLTMASVGTYLNFNGNTEEVFNFYKSVFGTEFTGIYRLADMPGPDGSPMDKNDPHANLIMHISLPITGGHVLMGTDATESMGFTLTFGNTVHIMLMPDSREEADRLFAALSAGGQVDMELADQVWGDYYGSFTDKYGIPWMIDVSNTPQ